MSFDSRIMSFSERFLSERTFELIVAPALADLQFEDSSRTRRAAGRLAVLRALAGGVRIDVARGSGELLLLTLLLAAYHIFLLLICFDVLSIAISTEFVFVAALILVLSFGPVIVCFWPERRRARPAD
jgi:hypothetical protein